MRSLVLAAAALASSSALAVDVLVLHGTTNNPTYHQDVVTYLAASGLFATVDVWAGDISVPTLFDLAAYDAVLLMSDGGWADPTLMGDRLAAYVDLGGGVVDTVFSNAVHNAGRFRTANYSPLLMTTPYGTPLSLFVVQAGHPLVAGVWSFADPAFHDDQARVAPGATGVAGYSNGAALEAVWAPTGAGTVVGLNLYPPSSLLRADFWDVNTDGEPLIANALLGAAVGNFPSPFSTQVSGACPGAANLTVHNARSNGRVAIVSGTRGSSTLPAGVCAGVALPIANPRLRAQGVADALGTFALPIRQLPQGVCGGRYVAVDLTTCAVASATLP